MRLPSADNFARLLCDIYPELRHRLRSGELHAHRFVLTTTATGDAERALVSASACNYASEPREGDMAPLDQEHSPG